MALGHVAMTLLFLGVAQAFQVQYSVSHAGSVQRATPLVSKITLNTAPKAAATTVEVEAPSQDASQSEVTLIYTSNLDATPGALSAAAPVNAGRGGQHHGREMAMKGRAAPFADLQRPSMAATASLCLVALVLFTKFLTFLVSRVKAFRLCGCGVACDLNRSSQCCAADCEAPQGAETPSSEPDAEDEAFYSDDEVANAYDFQPAGDFSGSPHPTSWWQHMELARALEDEEDLPALENEACAPKCGHEDKLESSPFMAPFQEDDEPEPDDEPDAEPH
eukprot:TRINITY_DN72310_c0_g1_i1.p1 TRINITY_DN72310_c0_g1~~TRINITY_DN72310_c0_g1_i1.p1  ORF type:complete len:277 (+),score=63.38 TRINITY_DN72310_c0_g1_i1:251-1081(+)